jgi:hypothetical protein
MHTPPTGLDLRSSSPTISIERCFEFRVALAARSLAPSLDAPDDDAVPVTTAGVAGDTPGPAPAAFTTGQTSPALPFVVTIAREGHAGPVQGLPSGYNGVKKQSLGPLGPPRVLTHDRPAHEGHFDRPGLSSTSPRRTEAPQQCPDVTNLNRSRILPNCATY